MNGHQELSETSINLVSEFPNEYRNKILKLVFSSYLPTALDRSKTIDNFSRDTNIPKEDVLEVLSVYITILGIFLQSNDNDFLEKLTDLGFSVNFIENLPFIGNRDQIINNLQLSYNSDFGKLSLFTWRIDISLAHSQLANKIPNFVMLSLTMKSGKKYMIALDPLSFNKLRFNVALMLTELNSLTSSASK